jgi:hypothetical protein
MGGLCLDWTGQWNGLGFTMLATMGTPLRYCRSCGSPHTTRPGTSLDCTANIILKQWCRFIIPVASLGSLEQH